MGLDGGNRRLRWVRFGHIDGTLMRGLPMWSPCHRVEV